MRMTGENGAHVRVFVVVMALAFVAVGSTSAASSQSESKEVALWLTSMDEALGGTFARSEWTSLSTRAACRGPDGAFETEVDSFRSDWVRFRQSSGDRTTEIWSGPERTWSIDAVGRVEVHGPEVRYFVRSHEFHLSLFEISERFHGFRRRDSVTVRDQPCATLQMEDASGQTASICISEETHLPVVLEMNPEGAAGPVRIYFDDWEDRDGVRLFRSFELTEGPNRIFRYDYTTIEPNTVSALSFVTPAQAPHQVDQEALLAILESDRRGHLATDIGEILPHLGNELIDVSAGNIRGMTKGQMEAFFTRLFDGATYHVWEDTEPPRIEISQDGTFAWIARRVEVRRSAIDEDGSNQHSHFVSAYSSTYETQDGVWKMTSVTSTFLPDTPDR